MDMGPYIGVQEFRDGSGRWLWSLIVRDVLHSAGICDGLHAADQAAVQALARLGHPKQSLQAKPGSQANGPRLLDLDALEQGGDE